MKTVYKGNDGTIVHTITLSTHYIHNVVKGNLPTGCRIGNVSFSVYLAVFI